MSKTLVLVTALLAGCSSAPKSAPLPPPATPPVAAIEEGGGWSKQVDEDVWAWSNDNGLEPSTTKLGTQPGGRGILAMTLPKGATSANLVHVYVSYASPGEATWSLYTASENGEPSGKAAWTSDVTITPDLIADVGQGPRYEKATQLEFGDAGAVTSPFFLVFTTRSGQPTVGAAAGDANVRYQPPGSATSQPVPFKAFIRMTASGLK